MHLNEIICFIAGALLAGLFVWLLAVNKFNSPATLLLMRSKAALDVILTRTSIRTYEERIIEPDKIKLLLQAAMSAPSAINEQPWAFVVVEDRALLQRLAEAMPYAKMTAKAPLAIVVCGDLSRSADPENAWWVVDASAASENLLLAAHAQGLGAVWTAVYPVKERVAALREILQLPDNIVPLNLIPVGYPASNPVPKQNWKPENVHHDGWWHK